MYLGSASAIHEWQRGILGVGMKTLTSAPTQHDTAIELDSASAVDVRSTR
jgi:hypothetical protein